jgi:hypothetical protein
MQAARAAAKREWPGFDLLSYLIDLLGELILLYRCRRQPAVFLPTTILPLAGGSQSALANHWPPESGGSWSSNIRATESTVRKRLVKSGERLAARRFGVESKLSQPAKPAGNPAQVRAVTRFAATTAPQPIRRGDCTGRMTGNETGRDRMAASGNLLEENDFRPAS